MVSCVMLAWHCNGISNDTTLHLHKLTATNRPGPVIDSKWLQCVWILTTRISRQHVSNENACSAS